MSDIVELIRSDGSEEFYSDFDIAFDSALSGDILKLLDNITLSDTLNISAKELTLDLNSYTAQTAHNKYAVAISNAGKFVIDDTSLSANGKVLCNDSCIALGTLTQFSNENSFVLNSGMMISQNYGVLALRGGNIDINGGSIISNNSAAIGINISKKYVAYPYSIKVQNAQLVGYATSISETNEIINISNNTLIKSIGTSLDLQGTYFDYSCNPDIHNKCDDKFENKLNNVQENNIVSATSKNSLYQSGNIFNLDMFGPTLYVKLDNYVQKNFRLMKIFDTDTLEDVESYYYDDMKSPWIDIPVDCLDLSLGLHTYTIELVNALTNDTFYQYFNYTIQEDNPDKPYIYMNR